MHKSFRHRAINFFLPAFNKLWLEDEDVGQDALIKELTVSFVVSKISRIIDV